MTISSVFPPSVASHVNHTTSRRPDMALSVCIQAPEGKGRSADEGVVLAG